jgi:predicted dehydrogenase
MEGRLGIGVVGLGDHAQRGHIDHLGDLERADVVAVCDPSAEARRRQLAAGFAGAVYESLDDLLADDGVSALIVCSPDRFHADALARAVAAGRHVLVEKPMADQRAHLCLVTDALAQAADRHLVVASCHPRRFDPPFLWLRRELPALRARLGRPLDVRFDFFYHRPSKAGLHHGLLIDHVSHEVDLLHFLFGHAPFISHRLADGDVRYGVAGSRQDGLCFTFFGSRQLDRRAYPEVMRVRFERGEVEVDTEAGVATVRDRDGDTTSTAPCGATDYEQRFRAVNRDFVNAALDGTAPYLSPPDLIVNTEAGIALTEDGHYDSSRSAASQLFARARSGSSGQ